MKSYIDSAIVQQEQMASDHIEEINAMPDD